MNNTEQAPAPGTARRQGRPTREQAELIRKQLLEGALDVFLQCGFEQTTMEAIARAAGLSKRTLYGHYDDKAALFMAAVRQAVDTWIEPLHEVRTLEIDDLDRALRTIARIGVAQTLSPIGLKIQRVMQAASYRFPEVFEIVYERGPHLLVDFLEELFARHRAAGTITIPNAKHAAVLFLRMVPGAATRGILFGAPLDPREIEELVELALDVFLKGIRTS